MNVIIIIALIFVNIKLLSKVVRGSSYHYRLFVLSLFVVHFSAFLVAYKVNIEIKQDSYSFYNRALVSDSISNFYDVGHNFMTLIIYPFVKIGISYFSISMAFSTLSFFSFMKYSRHFNKEIKMNKYIFLSLLLIPSLHYWTASLGKEALVFYLSTIILFKIYEKKYFTFSVLGASIVLLLIRPYLFFIFITAYIVNLLLNFKFSFKQRMLFFLSVLVVVIITLPVLQHFLKLETISIANFKENYAKIIAYSQSNGNSSINLKESNYIERLGIVLFRPLFFDAKTLSQYLVSVENLFVLILFLRTIYSFYKGKISISRLKDYMFPFSVIIGVVLFLSIYMYNLGLASRMRVMFFPYLFFLIISMLKTESYFCKKSIEKVN